MNTLRLYRPTLLTEIIHGGKVVNFEYAQHSSSRAHKYALITTWYTSEEEKHLGHKYMCYIHFFNTMGELTAEHARIINQIYEN